VYRRPINRFVAEFVGDGSVVLVEGRPMLVRPEDIETATGMPRDQTGWHVMTIQSRQFLGARCRLSGVSEIGRLTVEVPPGLPDTDQIFVRLRPERAIPL
jgi:hypothetical protein